MIVFHCTFLALRSYDAGKRTREIWDYELKGETKVFAGWESRLISGIRLTEADPFGTMGTNTLYEYTEIA
jgi:hypothetical protein